MQVYEEKKTGSHEQNAPPRRSGNWRDTDLLLIGGADVEVGDHNGGSWHQVELGIGGTIVTRSVGKQRAERLHTITLHMLKDIHLRFILLHGPCGTQEIFRKVMMHYYMVPGSIFIKLILHYFNDLGRCRHWSMLHNRSGILSITKLMCKVDQRKNKTTRGQMVE